jgi:hypothetical protein
VLVSFRCRDTALHVTRFTCESVLLVNRDARQFSVQDSTLHVIRDDRQLSVQYSALHVNRDARQFSVKGHRSSYDPRCSSDLGAETALCI